MHLCLKSQDNTSASRASDAREKAEEGLCSNIYEGSPRLKPVHQGTVVGITDGHFIDT